jgi:hypothetical protein
MNTLIKLADAYARNCFSDGVHDTVIEHPHTKKARAALVQGIEELQAELDKLKGAEPVAQEDGEKWGRYAWNLLANRQPTPQASEPVGINGLTQAETDASMSVRGLSNPTASEPAWRPIETAPKDGQPVWVKGYNFGEESKGIHCCWAWFDGHNWYEPGFESSMLMYLVSWMPPSVLAAAPEAK